MGGVDAEGIDNSGNVVYFFNGGGPSVFRDSQGSYQTIYVPGSVYTEVQGLNNRGEIVGFYLEDDMFHGFLWKGGSDYTTIDFPGAQYTVLSGINDDGTIVGFYAFPDSAADHGLVVTPISTPELSSAPMVGIALVFFATSMLGKRPRHL